jgi:hypothetical protein
MSREVVKTEIIRCLHCDASNLQGSFVCIQCGNLLDVPPDEKATNVLQGTGFLGFDNEQFTENSTLVLRIRNARQSYQLNARQLKLGQVIGRNTPGHDPKAHIDLGKYEAEQQGVSRRHTHLRYDPAQRAVKVADMKSANGTFVNGQRLVPGEVRVLRHGDKLRLGKLELGVTILHASTTIELF